MKVGAVRISRATATLAAVLAACLGLAVPGPAHAESAAESAERLRKATTTFNEMVTGKDPIVPRAVLAHARGVAVFPGVAKAAVIVGGHHGEGVVSVRRSGQAPWSPPAFYSIGGGSVGLQLGGQVVDLILVVMTEKGIEGLLKSKATLGGDVSLAAGPKSLHEGAGTDGSFKAEIFSYARSAGLFAGVSFQGSSMQPDGDAIRALYGPGADARGVLLGGKLAPPPAARELLAALRRATPPRRP
jgi:lipid-binding SYLF domain-containing protein